MQSIALFDLASRHNAWLAQRHSVLAGNIANANTPDFKARDVGDFETSLQGAMQLAATDPNHIAVATNRMGGVPTHRSNSGETLQSGNDVSLEQEFLKTSDVMRSLSLNNQIVKAFNRMLFSATKA
jgi:flagellar basal-body rod protein FlgB